MSVPSTSDEQSDYISQPQSQRGRPKTLKSYSPMTIPEVEKRLGYKLTRLIPDSVSVAAMLEDETKGMGGLLRVADEGMGDMLEGRNSIKNQVYEQILEYLNICGPPTELDPDFMEGNIVLLSYTILRPILKAFKHETGREGIKLVVEKRIWSLDGKTGGREDIVVVEAISDQDQIFIFIVETKNTNAVSGIAQCLLSMKDAWGLNGGGVIYGFVFTELYWQMIRYDGVFRITHRTLFYFDTNDKELWNEAVSTLIDCVFVALRKGGVQDGVGG